MRIATTFGRLWILLALYAVAPTGARAQDFRILHEVRSQYQRITVLDTVNGYRRLIFDGAFDGTDAIQSEVNLSRPDDLTLSYAQHMMAALPLVAAPRRILIVGLGGACMQRYLYKLLPGTIIETVELDAEIRRIASEYFFLKEDRRQIVHIADGRDYLENAKDKYDIIFLDAFSATSIPYPLVTREFFQAVKARIAENGLVAANLWDGQSDFPHILRTFSDVFPELLSLKCANSGNFILTALPKAVGLTVAEWTEKARAFEERHPTGLQLPYLIRQGARETTRIPENARVLHDRE